MNPGDVAWLHNGVPVLVLEAGEGEPGAFEGTGPNARWVDNADYRPAKVAVLEVTEVEQGSLAPSLEETAASARTAAIEDGSHSESSQFVYNPQEGESTSTAAAGADPTTGPSGSSPTVVGSRPGGADVGAGADETVATEQPSDTSWQEQARAAGWNAPGGGETARGEGVPSDVPTGAGEPPASGV